MIRKPILLLIVLSIAMLMLMACNGKSDPATNPEFREWGTLKGIVLDGSTNEPVVGASVDIKSIPFGPSDMVPGIIVRSTETDQDGTFQRTDVPIGDVQVRVRMSGYKTPPIQSWALTAIGTGHLAFKIYPGVDPVEKFQGDDMGAWDPGDFKH